MSFLRNGSIESVTLVQPTLQSMSEEITIGADISLPPTPELLGLPYSDPEPLDLPLTSLPLHHPATGTSSASSGATTLIECSASLDAMRTRLTSNLDEWRLAHFSLTKGTRHIVDSAKILSGVQQTPWNAQELQLCDLDGRLLLSLAQVILRA